MHAAKLTQARIRRDARKLGELHANLPRSSTTASPYASISTKPAPTESRKRRSTGAVNSSISRLSSKRPSQMKIPMSPSTATTSQTVGGKKAREAKRERKADAQARAEAAKKAKIGGMPGT